MRHVVVFLSTHLHWVFSLPRSLLLPLHLLLLLVALSLERLPIRVSRRPVVALNPPEPTQSQDDKNNRVSSSCVRRDEKFVFPHTFPVGHFFLSKFDRRIMSSDTVVFEIPSMPPRVAERAVTTAQPHADASKTITSPTASNVRTAKDVRAARARPYFEDGRVLGVMEVYLRRLMTEQPADPVGRWIAWLTDAATEEKGATSESAAPSGKAKRAADVASSSLPLGSADFIVKHHLAYLLDELLAALLDDRPAPDALESFILWWLKQNKKGFLARHPPSA